MIILPANNASLWTGPTGNNTYLLRGPVETLVDAGVGDAAHLDALAAALGGARLDCVLVTHGHSDHIGGLPAIRERWPSVRSLGAGELAGRGHVEAGDGRLRVIPTPGHAPDHLCFFDESTGDLYCGDLVRLGGTIVIPASKGGDLKQYLASLSTVRDLAPRRLLPGHGGIIDDPEAVIDRYLMHRAERDAQVLDALAAGCTTTPAMVERIYGPIPKAFSGAATDTVLAHLIKLQSEGLVVLEQGVWSLPPEP